MLCAIDHGIALVCCCDNAIDCDSVGACGIVGAVRLWPMLCLSRPVRFESVAVMVAMLRVSSVSARVWLSVSACGNGKAALDAALHPVY